MKDSDLQRLEHIKAYCEEIADAIDTFGASFEDFMQKVHYRNSVSMCLMQIGELTGGLSAEFKGDTPQMMWGLMRGMRNFFAHAYSSMQREAIWQTATVDIPILLTFCKRVLAQEE